MLKKLFQLPSKLRQQKAKERISEQLQSENKIREEIQESVSTILRERGQGCYHPENDQKKILRGEVPFTYFD